MSTKPKITKLYVEFPISGMDIKNLTWADEWMDKYCEKNNINKQKMIIEGNNDVPWLRYYFQEVL